jgi:hypothetical protein
MTKKQDPNTPGSRLLRMVKNHFPVVRTVEDAKRSVRLEVTQSDVDWSVKKNHNHCVFARTCERQLKADAALITLSRALVIHGTKAVRYIIPQYAKRELELFDRGGNFMPGIYTLIAPAPNSKIGAKRDWMPKTGKGKKRRSPTVTLGVRTSAIGSGLGGRR